MEGLMRAPGPRLGAVLAVLASAATGAVTNLITSQWTWTLAAVLAVLLLVSAALAAQAAGTKRDDRTRIRQTARGHSAIRDSGIRAARTAAITQTARRRGTIIQSSIDADHADIIQTAAKADIVNSPIRAEQQQPPAE
jgi:uncharacterized membrane protein YdbT with pleckstrin-like domain